MGVERQPWSIDSCRQFDGRATLLVKGRALTDALGAYGDRMATVAMEQDVKAGE